MEIGYTVNKLDEHTWMFSETNHRIAAYFYLIEGEDRVVIIDTGHGNIMTGEEVAKYMDRPVEAVICTHYHNDHIGGNGDFPMVYLSDLDHEDYIHEINGDGPAKPPRPVPYETTNIKEGDEFDLGGRTLRVIATPGHSNGSVCILDVEARRLYTGDTCLHGKNLAFSDGGLPEYIETLHKILDMSDQYDITYPSHYEYPVDTALIQRVLDFAEDIVAGKVELEPYDHPFFTDRLAATRDELILAFPPLD